MLLSMMSLGPIYVLGKLMNGSSDPPSNRSDLPADDERGSDSSDGDAVSIGEMYDVDDIINAHGGILHLLRRIERYFNRREELFEAAQSSLIGQLELMAAYDRVERRLKRIEDLMGRLRYHLDNPYKNEM